MLALIRSTVRQHAGDILVNQDPYDLYAVQDALLLNTADDLMPEGFPDLRIALTDARVVLDETAQAALADHDEAQRRQWQRANALRAQTIALKDLLVEPGLGLAWMAKTQPDSAVNRKQEIIDFLDHIAKEAGPVAEGDTLVEPLVELFREFVAPLTDPTQRQLVLKTLPAFFEYYGQYELAQKAEQSAAVIQATVTTTALDSDILSERAEEAEVDDHHHETTSPRRR
ncbi:hypothetical protein [Saccharopolyspora elongata]|uniref:Uncharacterized protein n=1 Tax=Saccharopolyspora elongata TaxID=2530387 RepID=A0A4R4Y8T9_9PSEU|nr:hypothetical protein [Saccharopolyspora elongata]TDD40845.1 hypothetical protein E1288_34435 [Saccharopolyspora elongata]